MRVYCKNQEREPGVKGMRVYSKYKERKEPGVKGMRVNLKNQERKNHKWKEWDCKNKEKKDQEWKIHTVNVDFIRFEYVVLAKY